VLAHLPASSGASATFTALPAALLPAPPLAVAGSAFREVARRRRGARVVLGLGGGPLSRGSCSPTRRPPSAGCANAPARHGQVAGNARQRACRGLEVVRRRDDLLEHLRPVGDGRDPYG
jgi:hypothetical protein